jgi:hypothetical protein
MTAALILLQAVPAAEAVTQRYTGSGAPPQLSRADRAAAVRTMQDFSSCVVQRVRPAKLDAYLRLPPGSAASNAAMSALAVDSCAPFRVNSYAMRFQADVMRAGLYDSLYRLRFKFGPIDIASVPKLDIASEFDTTTEPLGDASLYFRDIGDCVARKKPDLSRTLLMTRQGSKDEDAALKAIVPSVPSCVPQGSTIRFSTPILRGLIAEALYKLSMAARMRPPAIGKVDGK